ncbi:unnamed protein product, partial [Nesidiocoris tenuis]
MEEMGCFVLNGRSCGDRRGDLTYTSSNGASTVDQVWVNALSLNFFADFSVMDVDSGSDHFPCMLTSVMSGSGPTDDALFLMEAKLKWAQDKREEYRLRMKNAFLSSQPVPACPTTMYEFLKNYILSVSKELDMYKPAVIKRIGKVKRSPWFDKECCSMKYQVRKTYRKFKRKPRCSSLLKEYVNAKRHYRAILKNKKLEYYEGLRRSLSRCNDPSSFWSAVRKLRPTGAKQGSLTLEGVEEFFGEIYPLHDPGRQTNAPDFDGAEDDPPRDPVLDRPISKDELLQALNACSVADLEAYLIEKGHRGLSIDSRNELLAVLYADDCCLLADSKVNLQHLLDSLHTYCVDNLLRVNASKSKVVVFQRKGRQPSYNFKCGGEPVETVKSFTYLGVTFSRSGLFSLQASASVTKGINAYSGVWPIVHRSQNSDLQSWRVLFDSLIKSTSLYLAELWGLPYADRLERVQVRAFKSLLFLPRFTPDYAVRHELSLTHSGWTIVKGLLRWWLRLTAMEDTRLPKICFMRLLRLSTGPDQDQRFNWVLQLKAILLRLDCGDLLKADIATVDLKRAIPTLVDKYKNLMDEEDHLSLANSSFCHFSDVLSSSSQPTYMSLDLPLHVKRLVCQLRLAGYRLARIYFPRITAKFDGTATCSLCNAENAQDTVAHLLTNCLIFQAERARFFGERSLSEQML